MSGVKTVRLPVIQVWVRAGCYFILGIKSVPL